MTKSKLELSTPAREASASTLFWGLTRREAAILAAIVLAAIAIYLPSLRYGWVGDDWTEFVDNELIHSGSFVWNSFRYDLAWFTDPGGGLARSAYYRPLENMWFWANEMSFGNNPAAWHLVRIALQATAVVLCFRVAQLITGDIAVGLLTAAIFAVMPAHVDGVVWMSSIPEPLSTAFELGAMIFLIERRPGWSRGLFIALILYACATLTHESAILFPVIVFAYVYLFEGGDEMRTGRRAASAMRVCAPFLVVTVAYMCARLNALGLESLFGLHHRTTGALIARGFVTMKPHHTPVQVLMTLPVVLAAYLAILALPAVAGPTHSLEWITHPQPIVFITAAMLVLLAVAVFVAARRSSKRRIYLFCAVWSFVLIAPALNLNGLWTLLEDRYLYPPSFGWSLAIAVAAMQIAASGLRARRAVAAAMAVLLALYTVSTMQTEPYWHDDLTYFTRCVEIAPYDQTKRIALVKALNEAHDPEGAARTLERGTVLEPDDAHMHLKLAQQYQMMGRQLDFEREFLKFNELSNATISRQRAAASSDASPPAGTSAADTPPQ
jgi:hypothetical protein